MLLLASLLTVLTPSSMVSAIAIMSDKLMLALWIQAPLPWIEGLEKDKPSPLFWEGILIGFGALTRFCAIGLSRGKQK